MLGTNLKRKEKRKKRKNTGDNPSIKTKYPPSAKEEYAERY